MRSYFKAFAHSRRRVLSCFCLRFTLWRSLVISSPVCSMSSIRRAAAISTSAASWVSCLSRRRLSGRPTKSTQPQRRLNRSHAAHLGQGHCGQCVPPSRFSVLRQVLSTIKSNIPRLSTLLGCRGLSALFVGVTGQGVAKVDRCNPGMYSRRCPRIPYCIGMVNIRGINNSTATECALRRRVFFLLCIDYK